MVYNEDNVFLKVINGELPCNKVFEDSSIFAFHDINPVAPVHILVTPKKKFISFDDFTKGSTNEEVGNFFKKVQEIAESFPEAKSTGYRLVMNHGESSGQEIFHFHVHIIAGKKLGNL